MIPARAAGPGATLPPVDERSGAGAPPERGRTADVLVGTDTGTTAALAPDAGGGAAWAGAAAG